MDIWVTNRSMSHLHWVSNMSRDDLAYSRYAFRLRLGCERQKTGLWSCPGNVDERIITESLIEPVRTSRARSQTGSFRDFDCATHVSKAGHGNDRVWKAWKAKIPAFHPHSLEIPSGLPHSHGLDCWLISNCRAKETAIPLDLKGHSPRDEWMVEVNFREAAYTVTRRKHRSI